MNDSVEQTSQPFVSHLVELRNRILWAAGAVLGVFICLVPFAGEIYTWFAEPLVSNLPDGGNMIAVDPHGTFFIPFKLAFATAFAIAVPFVLYQVWAFVAPGLYKKEQSIILPLVVSSTLLFYLGILFAYFVVFPLIFEFFAKMTPEGVALTPGYRLVHEFCAELVFCFRCGIRSTCGNCTFEPHGSYLCSRYRQTKSVFYFRCICYRYVDDAT